MDTAKTIQASKRMLGLDIVKVLLIFYMIMDHLQNTIFSLELEEDYGLINQSDTVLQCINTMGFFVAGLFMFMMGISLNFSKRTDAGNTLKRANHIMLLALFVNFFRAIPLAEAMPYPTLSRLENYVDWICQNDILFFAAYFFYLRALTLRWKMDLKYFVLLLFAMFGASHFVDTSFLENTHFVIMDLVGHFVSYYSSFPLLSWVVYPACGILFGLALKHFGYTRRFHVVLTVIVVVLLAFGAWMAAHHGYLTWEKLAEYEYDTSNRYEINWLRVLWRVPCFLGIFALSYWLSLVVEKIVPLQNAVTYIASTLTNIYVVQWCVIALVAWAVKATVGTSFEPVNAGTVLAITGAVSALSIGISWCIGRFSRKQCPAK